MTAATGKVQRPPAHSDKSWAGAELAIFALPCGAEQAEAGPKKAFSLLSERPQFFEKCLKLF
jgi:hypothetical protein